MSTLIDIPLKGGRNYLHGTDIYSAIVEYFSTQGWNYKETIRFTLKFHGFAKSRCELFISPPDEQPKDFSTYFRVNFEDKIFQGWLSETGEPIDDRINSYESEIQSAAIREDKSIVLKGENEFPAIESVVFITKKLHYDLITPPDGKIWVFAALDISRLFVPRDTNDLKIVIKDILQNRFSTSDIFVGNEHIGEIYFSLA